MHIVCACDEKYLPHTATMLCSALTHTTTINEIHLIHNGLKRSSLKLIRTFVSEFGVEMRDYVADISCLNSLVVSDHASIANYFRLLIPDLLPKNLEKVVYLDSDIIVLCSLSELWNVNLNERPLAAVENVGFSDHSRLSIPEDRKYFNSGVLVIDVFQWRRKKIHISVLNYIRKNPENILFWDQDGLNALLYDEWVELDLRWNVQHNIILDDEHKDRFSETLENPFIIHFTGSGLKPWQHNSKHPFTQKYIEYRKKTPWKRFRPEGGPLSPRYLFNMILEGFKA